MDTEYNLINWNTHKDDLFASLPNLRHSELCTDVLVSCEDSFYPAHRLILALSSKYFSKALQFLPPTGNPVFVLCGMRKNILEAILAYIYEGKVAVPSADVISFMQAGVFLEVVGLVDVTKDIPTLCDGNILDDQRDCLLEDRNVAKLVKKEHLAVDADMEVLPPSPPVVEQNDHLVTDVQDSSISSDIPSQEVGVISQQNGNSNLPTPIIEGSGIPTFGIAKKRTRNSCRCTCCEKLFVDQKALKNHYIHMNKRNTSKQLLPSAESTDRNYESDILKDEICGQEKGTLSLCVNQSSTSGVKRAAENTSPRQNEGKSEPTEHDEIRSPKQVSSTSAEDNFAATTNLQSNENLKKRNKRIKLDDNRESDILPCSQLAFRPTSNILCSDAFVDEAASITEDQPLFPTIAEVVSMAEDQPLFPTISEVVSLNDKSSLSSCIGNEKSDTNSLHESHSLQESQESGSAPSLNKDVISEENANSSDIAVNTENVNQLSRSLTNPSLQRNSRQRLICDICNVEYFSFQTFKKHKQLECKILECPYCFSTYPQSEKDSLQEHMNVHLTQEKPFTCRECRYSTDNSRIMDDHIAIHGIYRFWCNLCTFKSKSVKEYQTHNENNHRV